MATIEWFEPQQRVILESRGDGLPPNPKRFTVGRDGVESITLNADMVVVRRKDGSTLTYLTQGVVMSKPEPAPSIPRKSVETANMELIERQRLQPRKR